MAYVRQDPSIPLATEPVALADLKDWIGVADSNSDSMLTALIAAAREYAEGFCGRSFCTKGYIQTLDSYPYFIDTIVSQQAYPPSYYVAPRYSTTLWNYSQMIKLTYGPLLDVSVLRYVASSDSTWQVLTGTTDMSNSANADFLGDVFTEPPRLFPKAGSFWPAVMYVPNSVEIHYRSGYGGPTPPTPALSQIASGAQTQRTYYVRLTYTLGSVERAASQEASLVISANNVLKVTSPVANYLADGYNVYVGTSSGQETKQNSSAIAIGTDWQEPDTGLIAGTALPDDSSFVPSGVKTAIMMLAASWFENREASSPLLFRAIPNGVEALLWMNKVFDVSPTRG